MTTATLIERLAALPTELRQAEEAARRRQEAQAFRDEPPAWTRGETQ